MDFTLTADQRTFVDSAQRLADTEFGRPSSRADIPAGVPRHYLATLARHGLAGVALPERQGGQGGSLIDAVLAIEAIASISPTAGDAIQALNFGAIQQIAHLGSAELKERFLAPCLRGDLLTAIAMTEPGAGSAVSRLSTAARRDGDKVVINGSKIFTTHGADADFFVVWTRFGAGAEALGAVVIERGAPGFTVDATNAFMSGEAYGVLYFDDCVVPAANVLVDQDGLRAMLPVFNIERIGNAARSLAFGQAAFDMALSHARDRSQFGRALSDFQGLQWRLAELALKLESARMLLYRAAATAGDGVPSAYDTAIAKLACNRAGFEAADAAVQFLGASGYDQESVAGYLFHRTRGWMIAGGTVEQMLNRISASLIGGKAAPGLSRLPASRSEGTA